jgi:hypothetical protein
MRAQEITGFLFQRYAARVCTALMMSAFVLPLANKLPDARRDYATSTASASDNEHRYDARADRIAARVQPTGVERSFLSLRTLFVQEKMRRSG